MNKSAQVVNNNEQLLAIITEPSDTQQTTEQLCTCPNISKL
jgi:hypothetical protein